MLSVFPPHLPLLSTRLHAPDHWGLHQQVPLPHEFPPSGRHKQIRGQEENKVRVFISLPSFWWSCCELTSSLVPKAVAVSRKLSIPLPSLVPVALQLLAPLGLGLVGFLMLPTADYARSFWFLSPCPCLCTHSSFLTLSSNYPFCECQISFGTWLV